MIERLILALLIQAGSSLLTFVLSKKAKKQSEPISETQLDKKVDAVKSAYADILDGKPATKEQREKINQSLRDLIRGV